MKIQQEIIDEIEEEIDQFLKRHAIDEKQMQSLLKAPALLNMLNQLYVESDLPLEKDLEVSSAVRYINSIYDFLPADFSGPMGSLDDILVAALVLKKLNKTIDLSKYCDKKPNFDQISKDIIELGEEYLPDYVHQRIQREFA
ncbi:MAG: hypothetical protein K9I29_09375 [Bacteroidales bacterium]|nr:hypothetical protein [Bacteroidales bacterium]MCF8328488.1 hypothetical protein [Bacteroidales bacterium]